MAGKPSARLVGAMLLLLANEEKPAGAEKLSAWACAKRHQITENALYKSRLYKQYLTAKSEKNEAAQIALLADLGRELEALWQLPRQPRPLPRVTKKPRVKAKATKKQH